MTFNSVVRTVVRNMLFVMMISGGYEIPDHPNNHIRSFCLWRDEYWSFQNSLCHWDCLTRYRSLVLEDAFGDFIAISSTNGKTVALLVVMVLKFWIFVIMKVLFTIRIESVLEIDKIFVIIDDSWNWSKLCFKVVGVVYTVSRKLRLNNMGVTIRMNLYYFQLLPPDHWWNTNAQCLKCMIENCCWVRKDKAFWENKFCPLLLWPR